MIVAFLLVFIGYLSFSIFQKKKKKNIKIGNKVILEQTVTVEPTHTLEKGRIGEVLDVAFTKYFLIELDKKKYWLHEERLKVID